MHGRNNALTVKLGKAIMILAVFGLSSCGKKAEEPVVAEPVQEEVAMSAAPADDVEPVIVADDLPTENDLPVAELSTENVVVADIIPETENTDDTNREVELSEVETSSD